VGLGQERQRRDRDDVAEDAEGHRPAEPDRGGQEADDAREQGAEPAATL
jgi:hypothetical protein